MEIITTSEDLAALCDRLSKFEYVTVDTEFMRERTFWPKLCLAQVASADEAVAIDALAEGIDLKPFFDLMANENVLKVFHAARQDVEIVYYHSGQTPQPLFDTQVAAMVAGFGDSVSYQALAAKLAKAKIDKSSRFTDWAHRPLSDRQLRYAIDDVVHLRVVYEKLVRRLEKSGRTAWVTEEMAALTDHAQYEMHPERAWRRIKTRATDPRVMAVLREVAGWREETAQSRDVPRNRILRDEALLEISNHPPRETKDLARIRGLGRSFAEGRMGREILDAVQRGMAVPDADCPKVPKMRSPARGVGPVVELMKVLLKLKCEEHDVAQRLVASVADLERIASEDKPDVAAMHGWRFELFGEDAQALKKGRLALQMRGRKIEAVAVEPPGKPAAKS